MKTLDLKNLAKKHQVLIGLILFSGLLALMAEFRAPDGGEKPITAPEASTLIPPGFVLVPIEVQNPEALDSILGAYGVVDLFSSPTEAQAGSRKVAERIKILRAPLNPNHFAVLAPEQEAPRLVGYTGPFSVVVQNPKSDGTNFVRETKKHSRLVVESVE